MIVIFLPNIRLTLSNYFYYLFLQDLILRVGRLYNVFGSGASHGLHAQFMSQSTLLNNGRKVNLLRGAGTRMASWFYAMHRALRVKPALVATVHQVQFNSIALVHTDERVRLAVNDIKDPDFWKRMYVISRAVYPAIRGLRYSDSDRPAMDKIYYLSYRTHESITKSMEQLNDHTTFPDVDIDVIAGVGVELEQIYDEKSEIEGVDDRFVHDCNLIVFHFFI